MCAQNQDMSVYDPSYRLLREAQESWQYALSDECVYRFQPSEVALDTFVGVAKDYIDGTCWIEAHFTFEMHGNCDHARVIIEVDKRNGCLRDIGKSDVGDVLVGRNAPMLVDIAQKIQSPQEMTTNSSSILSVIRLKRFDNGLCSCGYSVGVSVESILVGSIEDGKLCASGISNTGVSQSPDKLVKRGSNTVQEIPSNQSEHIGNVFDIKPQDVPLICNIVFTGKSYRLIFPKFTEPFPKIVKVFLRPSGFQVGDRLSYSAPMDFIP